MAGAPVPKPKTPRSLYHTKHVISSQKGGDTLHRTRQRTAFGDEVARFSFERNIPLTIIAQECGVSFETLRSVMYGRTPGTALVQTVRDFMASYLSNS